MIQRKKVRRRKQSPGPKCLVPVPREQWGDVSSQPSLIEVWRGPVFLVQVYQLQGDEIPCNQLYWPFERMSVTFLDHKLRRAEMINKITYNTLQRLKTECGRGGFFAMEPYPSIDHWNTVPNARHLLLFKEQPDYL